MTTPAAPHSWKRVCLGEVCSLRQDSVHPSANPDAVYVGLEHIDSGSARLSRHGLAAEVTSSKSKFYAGDLLYGKLRPYLDKAVLAQEDGICSTDILVIKSNDATLSGFWVFLAHCQAFLQHAIRTTRGVNHPRTSWQSLAEFEFDDPPRPEKLAIARALRAVQEAKEAKQRELTLERERKAALMQYLFTRGTTGEAVKQTEIGDIPESWDITTLGDLNLDVSDGNYADKYPRQSDFVKEGVPFIRANNINGSRIVADDMRFITTEKHEYLKKGHLKLNDVLVSTRGDIGKLALVTPGFVDCNINAQIVRINTKGLLDPRFFLYCLANDKSQRQFQSMKSGSTLAQLPVGRLNRLKISIPGTNEQGTIGNLLGACDNKLDTLHNETELLDELFKAMLEELITGRLSSLSLTKSETAA